MANILSQSVQLNHAKSMFCFSVISVWNKLGATSMTKTSIAIMTKTSIAIKTT